ncbi:hypothetical protein A8H27_17920 [Burkholderia cenocepacia]|nr:hypothetical protein A8H27_17920 [Burkholderia cenocepacia]PRG61622.1 hypothetical protein C6T64_31995 [Burkholderia cenocepacia]RQU00443.1 hypothetical protein DF165_05400 [Burkholderia cenocepacia]RQU59918.1 hypothetical protein DF146_02720 [Burkholderia cenocepacia]RSC44903.1 hypothetical protein EGT44_02860 [Burkholderia cenocepacia]
MISLFVIGFTIRKSKDLSPIKKCGMRAPRNGAVHESTGSKERDVAVDRTGGRARRQETDGTTGAAVRARRG